MSCVGVRDAMDLCLTIDTEADNQWAHGGPLTVRNVRYWPALQELCERHAVRPTWLITSEIARDGQARELLHDWLARGTAEVGAHLHPWTTPPFSDTPGQRHNDRIHTFASLLPSALLADKVGRLTEDVAEAAGAAPTSFRSGRFGFDVRCARHLRRHGYVVDSSVTPGVSPAAIAGDGRLGPDFRQHSLKPFLIDDSGGEGLVELPVTIVPTYQLLGRYPRLLDAYRWLPVRAVRRLVLRRWLRPQPVWLSPLPENSPADLLDVWRVAAGSGVGHAVMMLHSSELMPGGSPFRATPKAVAELLDCLDGFFETILAEDAGSCTLSEAAHALRTAGGLRERSL